MNQLFMLCSYIVMGVIRVIQYMAFELYKGLEPQTSPPPTYTLRNIWKREKASSMELSFSTNNLIENETNLPYFCEFTLFYENITIE